MAFCISLLTFPDFSRLLASKVFLFLEALDPWTRMTGNMSVATRAKMKFSHVLGVGWDRDKTRCTVTWRRSLKNGAVNSEPLNDLSGALFSRLFRDYTLM